MVMTLAAPTKKAKWATKLFRRVMCTWGIPGKVQTDNGNEYEGLFEYELRKYKIRHIRSSSYHPQSKGRVERANATLGQVLRKYVE